MCGAGHRRNQEEIVLTFADKVPLDIAFAGMAVVITCALGMMSVFEGHYPWFQRYICQYLQELLHFVCS